MAAKLNVPIWETWLAAHAPQPLIVISGSMAPSLNRGDLVLVTPQSDYRVNDMVSYRLAGLEPAIVTHRISEVKLEGEAETFVLKGDDNQATDAQPVKLTQIMGKVWGRIPLVGYLGLWLQTTVGAVILVVIPVTVIVYEELKACHYAIQKNKNHEIPHL